VTSRSRENLAGEFMIASNARFGVFPERIALALVVYVVLALSVPEATSTARAEGSPSMLWIRQFGTSEFDSANALAADMSGIYVAGDMGGPFLGTTTNTGFLRKYDPDGNVLWTSVVGDYTYAVALGASGAFVVGATFTTLPNETSVGGIDAFVRKYDTDGGILWTRQFGTSSDDYAFAVVASASLVYVAGHTRGTFPGEASEGGFDAFVREYDTNGSAVWTSQFGTSADDSAVGIAVAPSGAYVTGVTGGSFPGETNAGGPDGFLRRYSMNGSVLWTRQFGSPLYDLTNSVATDSSGAYVAGYTSGSDAFLTKYDVDGNLLWIRRFGAWGPFVSAVALGSSGIYVAGGVAGTFPGQVNSSSVDVFLGKSDLEGYILSAQQFGRFAIDGANSVASAGSRVYVAGYFSGTFPGETSVGKNDAFVSAFSEPGSIPTFNPLLAATVATAIAVASALVVLMWKRRRGKPTSPVPPPLQPPKSQPDIKTILISPPASTLLARVCQVSYG